MYIKTDLLGVNTVDVDIHMSADILVWLSLLETWQTLKTFSSNSAGPQVRAESENPRDLIPHAWFLDPAKTDSAQFRTA